MSTDTYHVQADWDPVAGVWVATSEDVPGLATEGETTETLTEKLRTIVPELLHANQIHLAGSAISLELTSHRQDLEMTQPCRLTRFMS